jgi:hypothetical protein
MTAFTFGVAKIVRLRAGTICGSSPNFETKYPSFIGVTVATTTGAMLARETTTLCDLPTIEGEAYGQSRDHE